MLPELLLSFNPPLASAGDQVRDMILRKNPSADKALEINRQFVEYQKFFGAAQKLGKKY